MNTTTGNQAVTGIGFQPKALILFGNSRTSNGSSPDVNFSYGMAVSSTSRACIAGISKHGFTTTDSERYHTNAKCVTFISTPGTVLFAADFVSFGVDGFTLNVTTTDAIARKLNVVCFGGDDLQVFIKQWTTNAVTGNQNVTGVGFSPDFVFNLGVNSTTALPIASAALFAQIGAATSNTAQFGISSRSDDAITGVQVADKKMDTDIFYTGVSGGAVQAEAAYVTKILDGFTANITTASGARIVSTLCMKGGQYHVGVCTQKTSSGTEDITNCPFQPEGVILISGNNVHSDNPIQDSGISFGASDGTNTSCVFWRDIDNATPTKATSTLDSTYAVIHAIAETNGSVPTIQARASVSALLTNGFTFNWETADATLREIVYIAYSGTAAAVASFLIMGDDSFIV